MKKRADILLVEKQLVENRTKAQAMILAGQVFINEKKILKSGELINIDSKLKILNLHSEWVSRGAIKLKHVFDTIDLNIKDYICLDIGSSTGGFSEVLLKNHVKKIYAVDVGTNQLHEKLRKENRIISMEKINARYLNKEIISDIVDLIVCDVSFISMKKVIEPSLEILNKKKGLVIGLIKPQFEASRKEIKKGGVILDPKIHQRICDDYKNWFFEKCSMNVYSIIESPIQGPKGNKEFFIIAKYN